MLDELSWYPEQEWSLDTGWYEVTDCRTTIEMSGLNAIEIFDAVMEVTKSPKASR